MAFTRAMLPRILDRFIGERKSRMESEAPDVSEPQIPLAEPDHQEGPDDEQVNQLESLNEELEELKRTNEETYKIIMFRLEDPPLDTPEIARRLNMKPAAVRKRISRFYEKVLKRSKRKR